MVDLPTAATLAPVVVVAVEVVVAVVVVVAPDQLCPCPSRTYPRCMTATTVTATTVAVTTATTMTSPSCWPVAATHRTEATTP